MTMTDALRAARAIVERDPAVSIPRACIRATEDAPWLADAVWQAFCRSGTAYPRTRVEQTLEQFDRAIAAAGTP